MNVKYYCNDYIEDIHDENVAFILCFAPNRLYKQEVSENEKNYMPRIIINQEKIP